DELTNFHPIFVAVNANLCNHVRKYLTGLERSLLMQRGRDPQQLLDPRKYSRLPSSLADIKESQWPLVCTYAAFLRMVDATLSKPFFVEPKEDDRKAGDGQDQSKKDERDKY